MWKFHWLVTADTESSTLCRFYSMFLWYQVHKYNFLLRGSDPVANVGSNL